MTTFNGKKVLTNAQGMAVYSFAIDSSTKSNCSSSCLKFWPIVPGRPPPVPVSPARSA